MTELEVNADSLVVSIVDGPEVLPGEGPVVTGRFVTRQASDLVHVTFAGGVQLIGTHSHPIWSPLHQDWRALGEFEPGDLVQARTGLVPWEHFLAKEQKSLVILRVLHTAWRNALAIVWVPASSRKHLRMA